MANESAPSLKLLAVVLGDYRKLCPNLLKKNILPLIIGLYLLYNGRFLLRMMVIFEMPEKSYCEDVKFYILPYV